MIELKVENLGKYFGTKWVFRGLTFEGAEVLGIAGSNGSGKSTLFRCLAGLYRADVGQVSWYVDRKLLDRDALRKTSGFAAPYIRLYDGLTCRENLVLLNSGKVSESFKGSQTSQNLHQYIEIDALLADMGLGEKAELFYRDLSSGQQQRLKLAASLLSEPLILFLDEPTTNLDDEGRKLVEKLVENRRGKRLMTLIASNDREDIALCDKVVKL